MKTVLFFSILLCLITLPTFGELLPADLDKIRLIVKEENAPIKAEITSIKTDIAWVRGKFEGVDKQFEGVDKQFEGVSKQTTHATNVTYALIALIVFAVSIPQIIIARRSKKDFGNGVKLETLTREEIEAIIETLTREIKENNETLTREVEALKQQHIANP